MQDTVTIEVPTGFDGQSRPTYGAPVSYRCRVDIGYERRYLASGIERTASAVVVLDRDTVVPGDARLTLPDGNTPPIVESNLLKGLGGLVLCEVVLGQ